MLIKVGKHRINLAHVACVTENPDAAIAVLVGFVSGDSLELINADATDFLKTWDEWAEFQNDAQAINEFAVAENLKQIKAAQNKSGIIQPVPKMPLVNRRRG